MYSKERLLENSSFSKIMKGEGYSIKGVLPKPANIYTMYELEKYCTVPVFNVVNLVTSKTK